MVLTADPEGTPAPRVDDRSTIVRLRSRYVAARDSTITVAIYVGEPPVILDGCVVEEVAWSWASTSDNGVVTVADAGGGTLTLYDPERRFDPTNDTSENALTKIGTRVQVVVGGVPAFTGRVDDVTHDLVTCQVAIVDDVSALASVQFTETSVPAETVGTRIGRILDMAAWPAARRSIEYGGVALQAGTVASDAWSELVEANRNELGALWVSPDGSVYWRNRASAWVGAGLTEYAVNGSFEAMRDPAAQYPWPSDWVGQPSESYMQTTANNPEFVRAGTRCFYIGTSGVDHNATQMVALTPGVTYTLSAWGGRFNTYAPSPAWADVAVSDPDNGYAYVASIRFTNQLAAGGPLLYRSQTFVCPPGGRVQLQVGVAAAFAVGQDFFFDLVSVAGPPYITAMTVGCPPSDVPLVALATRGDQSDLVNILTAARRTGTARTVTDPASLTTYGRHSHNQLDLELSTDALRDAWQDFYIRRQAQPIRGVAGFACRPGSLAITKALALPFGAIIRVKDEGHGPTVDRLARLVGSRWRITPSLVEWVAVTGEDASFRPVARSAVIDTPAEWRAAAPVNLLAPYGDFDSLAGWAWQPSGYSAASVVTSTDATRPSGSNVLRVPGSTPVYAYPGVGTSPRIPVQPGVTYQLRGATKKDPAVPTTGVQADIGMHTYNAAGVLVTANQRQLVWGADVGAEWSYRSATWTAPADGSVASVFIECVLLHPGPGPDHSWLFDDVTFSPILNVAYTEPGVAPAKYQAPSGLATLRDILEEVADAIADVDRPSPQEGDDGNP